MRTVTKQALIDHVAKVTGGRRADVKRTITAFLDEMVEQLACGNRIECREFGIFEPRNLKARIGRNPRTKVPVEVPARRGVRFKVGQQARDRLAAAAVLAETQEPRPAPVMERRRVRRRARAVEREAATMAQVPAGALA